jgi:hypothetical protein
MVPVLLLAMNQAPLLAIPQALLPVVRQVLVRAPRPARCLANILALLRVRHLVLNQAHLPVLCLVRPRVLLPAVRQAHHRVRLHLQRPVLHQALALA